MRSSEGRGIMRIFCSDDMGRVALGAATLLLAAMPVTFADDWTMGGHDLQNSRSQSTTGISSQNVAQLKTKWVFTTGGDVSATPAVANGIVYFPDMAGNFYAVDAATGNLVWQQKIG